ncbi:MAG: SCO family protein [Aquificae bacterium]|nr:SCO family protein [Aquificota bacterium]
MRLLLLLLLFFSLPSAQTGSTGIPPNEAKVLNTFVPEDVPLVDDKGRELTLKDLKGKPVIIAPIYTTCRSACPLIIKGLKEVVPKVGKAGKDFHVVVLTFNPKDTLENMKKFRKEQSIPESWLLVKAKTPEELFRILDAIDFKFMTAGQDFIHPNLLVFLSPELQIKKYLYGVSYDRLEFINALRIARGELALPDNYRSYLFLIGMFGMVATSAYIAYTLGKVYRRKKKAA